MCEAGATFQFLAEAGSAQPNAPTESLVTRVRVYVYQFLEVREEAQTRRGAMGIRTRAEAELGAFFACLLGVAQECDFQVSRKAWITLAMALHESEDWRIARVIRERRGYRIRWGGRRFMTFTGASVNATPLVTEISETTRL
jgi:hypothetical protein